MSSRAIAIATLFLLTGCASFKDLRHNPDPAPETLRILTINAWSGLTYDGVLTMDRHEDQPEARYRALVEGIMALDPDIIAVQEANPLPDYAARMAEDLDYQFVCHVALGGIRFGPVGIPTNLREGGAVLVKRNWPLEDLGTERLGGGGVVSNWFCFHLEETTQAILVRVTVGGGPLYVCAVHLHAGGADVDRRQEEIQALGQFIDRAISDDAPAIVLGDFNATVESGELDPLLGEAGLHDTYSRCRPSRPGFTWDPGTNRNIRGEDSTAKRIDLILIGGSLGPEDVLASEVVLRGTGSDVPPSDHYGVLTTLRLRDWPGPR